MTLECVLKQSPPSASPDTLRKRIRPTVLRSPIYTLRYPQLRVLMQAVHTYELALCKYADDAILPQTRDHAIPTVNRTQGISPEAKPRLLLISNHPFGKVNSLIAYHNMQLG
jgi:hypothetical protein